MGFINDILTTISDFVWGWPMASILLLTGIILTIRTIFIQVRGFAHGVGIATGKYDDPDHKGELTHFQALTAALSATIGIGNIAGVAIGIYYGGPGAIFWMWITACFGMAIKYSECMLAIKYRKVEEDGNIRGGPMYFIELGMHKYFKPLAFMFALCTAIAAFGAGNMVQSNTMALTLVGALDVGGLEVTSEQVKAPEVTESMERYNRLLVQRQRLYDNRELLDRRVKAGYYPDISQAGIESVVESLQELTDELAPLADSLLEWPLVAVTDASGGVTVYTETAAAEAGLEGDLCNLKVINAQFDFAQIDLVKNTPVRTWRWIIGIVVAGLAGMVIIGGIRRIGHVASWLVPIMSVIYVVSALVVIVMNFDMIGEAFRLIFYHAFNPTAVVGGSVSGATFWMTFTWGLRRGLFSNEAGQGSAAMAHSTAKVEEPVREGLVAMLGPFIDTLVICTMTALVIIMSGMWASGDNGAVLTMNCFNHELPVYGRWMVVLGVMLFAFSTVLAWSYYGEKGIEYIAGKKAKLPYKWVYIVFTLLGAALDLEAVWSYADVANGLMAVPNLVALVALSGVIVVMTKKYMDEKANGLHIPYKKRLQQQQRQQ